MQCISYEQRSSQLNEQIFITESSTCSEWTDSSICSFLHWSFVHWSQKVLPLNCLISWEALCYILVKSLQKDVRLDWINESDRSQLADPVPQEKVSIGANAKITY